MKKFLFPFIGAAIAIASLTGCQEKSFENDNDIQQEVGGETGYITFSIKSADTGGLTRAWHDDDENDYAPGEQVGQFANEDEIVNNLQANRMFFFREDNTYHSSSLLSLEEDGGSHDASHGSNYPEKFYSATVKRTSDRGIQDWPTQCLVVLNGRPSALNAILLRAQADENFNLPEFLSWINNDFGDGAADGEGETLGLYKYTDESSNTKYYFTMTNSIFIDGGTTDLTDEKVVHATQIPEGALQATSELAKANPVTVYVERIVAKVEVGFTNFDGQSGDNVGYFSADNTAGFVYSFKDVDGNPSYEGESEWFGSGNETPITLKAVITNWTINAVEYKTKLFKDLDYSPLDSNPWNADIPFEGWNDPNHHRSYWARDVHYLWNASEYPTQYRTAFNGVATPYQDDWEYGKDESEENGNDIFDPNYSWALDYKSYEASSLYRKHKYCLENTFDISGEQNNYKHMIMGSHLLIKARLIMDGESSEDLDAISDKYYYSDRYYDEATYISRQVGIINELLGENVLGENVVPNIKMWAEDTDGSAPSYTYEAIKGGLWIKDGGTYKRILAAVNAEPGENEVLATEVFGIAPAYVLKGDGKVSIALLGEDNGFGYGDELVNLYYNVDVVEAGTQPDDPVQLTRNELVSLIYGITNIADCFKNGRMYYAVPIEHFIAVGAGNDYEAKYENIHTGDYGIVRNHWYRFTINNIVKPGIPVHDPDQPIIPNYDDEDRYLGLQVVIIPWHVVDNGNVSLGN